MKEKLCLPFWVCFWVAIFAFGECNRAAAGFLSQASLSVSEEYNDNITFEDARTADFVTGIKPAISLFYKPFASDTPTFTAVVESLGQIFARNSSFNNFGKNTSFGTAYIHRQTPKLEFYFSNTLRRVGETRTQSAGPEEARELVELPTQFPTSGALAPPPVIASAAGLVATGNAFGNIFTARTRYQYKPKLAFSGDVSVRYIEFLDEGGSESTEHVGARATYKWGESHNFHLGFRVRGIQSRNGDNDFVFDFDFGDDILTRFDFQLTPTLKLSARTGASMATRKSGVRVVNHSNFSLEQIWKKAQLTTGFRHGLTTSLGVSGPSRTTSAFGRFNMRFTELISGSLGATFSYFDTDDTTYSTVVANAGLQYWILHWLRADLNYAYWMRNGGTGSSSSIVAGVNENPSSNSIYLRLTARFDLYPTVGLAKWIPFR